MEEISKTNKIKLFFIFLLSNISVYLLASSPPEEGVILEEVPISEIRQGYVNIRIKGQLLCEFDSQKAVSIYHKNQLVIPHAFLLKRINTNSPDSLMASPRESSTTYLIQVPRKYLGQLMKENHFKILPYGPEIKFKRKGNNYETSL